MIPQVEAIEQGKVQGLKGRATLAPPIVPFAFGA